MTDQPALAMGSGPQNITEKRGLVWTSFPPELRCKIFEYLPGTGRGWSACASVCKEWQAELEKENFRRLKVTAADLETMAAIIPDRANLVRHLWLNIELLRYSCQACRQREGKSWYLKNHNLIRKAIEKLWAILSGWRREGAGLTLELSMQSPSDKEHFFKNFYFGGEPEGWVFDPSAPPTQRPNMERNIRAGHDEWHHWIDDRNTTAPFEYALERIFGGVYCSVPRIPANIPRLPMVDRLEIRRQTRRPFEPHLLENLVNQLPELKSFTYELWQKWHVQAQQAADRHHVRFFGLGLPRKLRELSVFEETNEAFASVFVEGYVGSPPLPNGIRMASPQVGAAFATLSLLLEKLSVAFMIEAWDFFSAYQPGWVWDNLTSLVLTSRRLIKPENNQEVDDMERLLSSAAEVALSMPVLKTMVIWNFRMGHAFKFYYCAKDTRTDKETVIGWRGTWDFNPDASVINSWAKVARKNTRYNLRVTPEPNIDEGIKSLAKAIKLLDLPSEVVHPESLLQMLKEADTSWV
ncbi:hypothetical protein CPLU01_14507 [Colletotrichum plurivorum]|uniref:DUF6546 domain-containing protein n=1 Tax=Colletotrichum plurivorum TaxID=2175906 RepID=A0A8H6JJI2_9PEZI|nr:hypothetical protein CPLU01_14507 [Colletotrichum plurivorum]